MMFLRTLCLWAGILGWTTPLWYPLIAEIRYRNGIGEIRRGKVQRFTLVDWLNATGVGMFCGQILLGIYWYLGLS